MGKSTFFTGQPIFTQLLSLLNKSAVARAIKECKSDRYYKKLDTYHHLVSMLYTSFQHCTGLREVVTGMQACEGKLQSTGIRYLPPRSTLGDANKDRSYVVFEKIYLQLYYSYKDFLPDSRKNKRFKGLILLDSTTISLFKEILKAAGPTPLNGKRKGGIKVHMATWAHEGVPFLAQFDSGASADVKVLKNLQFPKGSVAVFDKAFRSFKKYNEWTRDGVFWVTRSRIDAVYDVLKNAPVSKYQKARGVISDQTVLLGFKGKKEKVKCRLIKYYDNEKLREFTFITNNFKWKAASVADIYRQRWGIELLFKRLKQNMQLQYFLGDSENAIKIQIYCSLIADLILNIIKAKIKRAWAFSTLASLVRLHLMNYTDLLRFLENPEKAKIYNPPTDHQQLHLSLSG
ncbi:MAG: IS4 family transposase [Bacteroidota bacterium]|nr:IS4 family transposase [Bacteroidota bacterium]